MTEQPRRPRWPGGGQFSRATHPEATGIELTDDDEAIDHAEQKREARLARTIAELVVLCDDAAELASRGRASFDTDWLAKRAAKNIITELQETLSRLPLSYRERHPDMEWALARGMTNRVVHEYQDTDDELLWMVIVGSIPQMRRQLDI